MDSYSRYSIAVKKATNAFFQLFHTIPCCQPKFVAQILSKNSLFAFFFSVFFDFRTEYGDLRFRKSLYLICIRKYVTEKMLYLNLFCPVIYFMQNVAASNHLI